MYTFIVWLDANKISQNSIYFWITGVPTKSIYTYFIKWNKTVDIMCDRLIHYQIYTNWIHREIQRSFRNWQIANQTLWGCWYDMDRPLFCVVKKMKHWAFSQIQLAKKPTWFSNSVDHKANLDLVDSLLVLNVRGLEP